MVAEISITFAEAFINHAEFSIAFAEVSSVFAEIIQVLNGHLHPEDNLLRVYSRFKRYLVVQNWSMQIELYNRTVRKTTGWLFGKSFPAVSAYNFHFTI